MHCNPRTQVYMQKYSYALYDSLIGSNRCSHPYMPCSLHSQRASRRIQHRCHITPSIVSATLQALQEWIVAPVSDCTAVASHTIRSDSHST